MGWRALFLGTPEGDRHRHLHALFVTCSSIRHGRDCCRTLPLPPSHRPGTVLAVLVRSSFRGEPALIATSLSVLRRTVALSAGHAGLPWGGLLTQPAVRPHAARVLLCRAGRSRSRHCWRPVVSGSPPSSLGAPVGFTVDRWVVRIASRARYHQQGDSGFRLRRFASFASSGFRLRRCLRA